MKKSFVFLTIIIFFFIFLIKVSNILTSDKSNYYLPFEELNYLIEYCNIKDESILSYFDHFELKNNTVKAKKGNYSFYINC